MKYRNNYSDAKWCIDNDWQVYVKPDGARFKIAIRKGGISSCGKDVHYDKATGKTYTSEENLGSVMYKTQIEAEYKLADVYEYLRKRYGSKNNI